ncbi:MAG: FG-GAP repeat domain-containing protein, partial [Gemmataceae bacterium]
FKDGNPISISGVNISGSGKSYQLLNLGNHTTNPGSYLFQIKNQGNGITDSFGNPLATPVSVSWVNNYIPLTSNFQINSTAGKPIDSLQIVFNKPVTGFGLGNLRLSKNNSNISTTNLSLNESFPGSGVFTLAGLSSINQDEGSYRIYLTNTSTILDASGYSVSTQRIQDNWVVVAQAPAVIATKINSGNGTFAIVNPETGQTTGMIQPFPEFTGAIHVQQGNLLPNGHTSLVTAAGDGGGPHIVVYDLTNNSVQRSFFAYSTEFRGGVFIAVGDLTGDGIDDLVTGPNKGGGPHVKVFDGRTNQVIREFMAYDTSFRGGVSVSIADVNGDNRLDIITGSGSGGGPNIKVFDFTS